MNELWHDIKECMDIFLLDILPGVGVVVGIFACVLLAVNTLFN